MSRLPDGRVSLVFRVLDDATGDLTLLGPRRRALFKTKTGIARVISIDLKPGWSPQLFGVPASVLTERIVYLQDIWGTAGAELCDRLLETHDVEDILDQMSHALASRAATIDEPASARLARRAVRLLEHGDVRISSVANQLGVTSRHLRRAFTESVGIGPKDYARAVRLNRVVRGVTAAADWGRLATDAGYYDQSHLITEFRELVGLTPRAFAKHWIEPAA